MSTTVVQNNTVTVTQDATKTVTIVSPGPKGDPGLITSNTGGTIGGDFTVQGDITSSGNISASGTISAGIGTNKIVGVLQLGGGLQNITDGEDYITFSANQVVEIGDPSGAANGTIFKVDDSKNSFEFINGNITASGNISASGDLFANEITLKGPSAGITIESDASTEILCTTTDSFNIGSAGHLYFLAGSGKELRFGSDGTNDHVRINRGHITASGNISASGTIIAEQLTTSDDLTVGSAGNGKINVGSIGTVDGESTTTFNVKTIGQIDLEADTDNNNAGVLDRIRFNIGGSEIARISGSGKVGIGTTSPTENLHVSESIRIGYPTGRIVAKATDEFYAEIIPFNINGETIINNHYPDGEIIFQSGSNEVARFKDGKLGIGTTSPSAILDIEDSSGVTIDINSSTGDGKFRYQDNGTTKWSVGRDNTNQNFVFASGSALGTNNILTLEYAGNVGIGTSNPTKKLHVQGVGETAFVLEATDPTNVHSPAKTSFIELRGYDGRGSGMLLTESGSLSAKEWFIGKPYIDSANSIIIGYDAINGRPEYEASASVTIQNNNNATFAGNIGIGTTPSYKLHVNAGDTNTTAVFQSTDDKAFIIIKDDNTDSYLISKDNKFYIGADSSNTSRFNVDLTTGNVGIGVSSPTAKLHVSESLVVHASQIDFTDLPTSNPNVNGRLWNNNGVVNISTG